MNDPRTTANDFIHEKCFDEKMLMITLKMKLQKYN